MKKASIYYRLELPDAQDIAEEKVQQLKNYADELGSEILGVYIEDVLDADEKNPPAYVKMMEEIKKMGPDFILVETLSHISHRSLTEVFYRLKALTRRGRAVNSLEDKIEVNGDNLEEIERMYRLFNRLNERRRKEKINLGFWKKKQQSPDGKVHRAKGGNNYRKTDKDDVVSRKREEGYTLKEIAESEGISVGRVRAILKALDEMMDAQTIGKSTGSSSEPSNTKVVKD